MFVRRLTTSFKEQHWMTLVIELVIVIVGVFIGTWVANRNQEVVERESTIRLLNQFKSEIQFQAQEYQALKDYMAVTGDYARVAEAGWRNDLAVSDPQFVIAAYQASQITGTAINTQSWASMFGAGQVQNVQDPVVRSRLIRVLSLDSSVIGIQQLQSDYRKDVRSVIPGPIQDAIRARCGDIFPDTGAITSQLPARCDLVLPPEAAREAATALRAKPVLTHELDWHRAAVASLMGQYGAYIRSLQSLSQAIDQSSIKARRP